VTACHSTLFTLRSGHSGLGFYTTQKDAAAEGLSNKDILRCLKRFIAREVFHLLMGKPPRRTAAT